MCFRYPTPTPADPFVRAQAHGLERFRNGLPASFYGGRTLVPGTGNGAGQGRAHSVLLWGEDSGTRQRKRFRNGLPASSYGGRTLVPGNGRGLHVQAQAHGSECFRNRLPASSYGGRTLVPGNRRGAGQGRTRRHQRTVRSASGTGYQRPPTGGGLWYPATGKGAQTHSSERFRNGLPGSSYGGRTLVPGNGRGAGQGRTCRHKRTVRSFGNRLSASSYGGRGVRTGTSTRFRSASGKGGRAARERFRNRLSVSSQGGRCYPATEQGLARGHTDMPESILRTQPPMREPRRCPWLNPLPFIGAESIHGPTTTTSDPCSNPF